MMHKGRISTFSACKKLGLGLLAMIFLEKRPKLHIPNSLTILVPEINNLGSYHLYSLMLTEEGNEEAAIQVQFNCFTEANE